MVKVTEKQTFSKFETMLLKVLSKVFEKMISQIVAGNTNCNIIIGSSYVNISVGDNNSSIVGHSNNGANGHSNNVATKD